MCMALAKSREERDVMASYMHTNSYFCHRTCVLMLKGAGIAKTQDIKELSDILMRLHMLPLLYVQI